VLTKAVAPGWTVKVGVGKAFTIIDPVALTLPQPPVKGML
jgi:hypothetical protein